MFLFTLRLLLSLFLLDKFGFIVISLFDMPTANFVLDNLLFLVIALQIMVLVSNLVSFQKPFFALLFLINNSISYISLCHLFVYKRKVKSFRFLFKTLGNFEHNFMYYPQFANCSALQRPRSWRTRKATWCGG